MRVLIIDDEPFALKLHTHQFESLGIRKVTACERADDALELLEADITAFDLVVCDLQMPHMDGVEFVRHLGRLRLAASLVLISGEDTRILQTAEKLARAHHLNIRGALCKPISIDDIRRILLAAELPDLPKPRAARRNFSVEELRQAIAGGELSNHYQPKIDIASGAVAGVETLVRWQHPRDGLVFPDQFIATAEEHGLIDSLTHAVLSLSLRQMRNWLDDGIALHVAVNVSMDDLADLRFPERIVHMAQECGVPASSLTLEVTESRLMRDPLAVMDILARLRLKRIGVSIDDFGTGHSSLAQLRDIPFDELKIDRGFVHGAAHDRSLRAIFDGSLGMARQLGMRVVAEGVEDEDDWRFLVKAGCDLAQGYFIARPMPAADVVPWLAQWEQRRHELIHSAQ